VDTAGSAWGGEPGCGANEGGRRSSQGHGPQYGTRRKMDGRSVSYAYLCVGMPGASPCDVTAKRTFTVSGSARECREIVKEA
jgi:hypothetical protein